MKPRSLWPREHGAYVQLLAPLVVALAIAPSLAGALLAIGASAAFLAHEPLLVLLGRRGRRAQIQNAQRAKQRLALCIFLACGGGLAGLVLAPDALALAPAVGIAAVVTLGLSWLDRAHTLGGELGAAAALAGAAAPVGVAGGLPTSSALTFWVMWALAFASTVVAVHVVIISHKRRATGARWILWTSILAASGAGITIGWWRSPAFAAAVPLWLAAVAVTATRPPATSLRRVGVLLAVVTAAAATWLIART